jgi:DNA-directed RNA polymerase specialized sigma24 family protein
MSEGTRIRSALEQGDPDAAPQLLPLVHDELRKLAAERMTREAPGHALQATALVHEAYLRLVDTDKPQRGDSRGHFFAAAAAAMRRVELDAGALLPVQEEQAAEDLLALDEALRQFEVEDPLQARLVNLRYFGGLSIEDAARALDISPASAKRYWVYARSWLYGKVHGR